MTGPQNTDTHTHTLTYSHAHNDLIRHRHSSLSTLRTETSPPQFMFCWAISTVSVPHKSPVASFTKGEIPKIHDFSVVFGKKPIVKSRLRCSGLGDANCCFFCNFFLARNLRMIRQFFCFQCHLKKYGSKNRTTHVSLSIYSHPAIHPMGNFLALPPVLPTSTFFAANSSQPVSAPTPTGDFWETPKHHGWWVG